MDTQATPQANEGYMRKPVTVFDEKVTNPLLKSLIDGSYYRLPQLEKTHVLSQVTAEGERQMRIRQRFKWFFSKDCISDKNNRD